LEVTDAKGRSPIIKAAQERKFDCVKALVDHVGLPVYRITK